MVKGRLKMIENKKYWKVSWNKKLYDYERAVKEFKEGKRKFILQSRGKAHMVQCPTVGHIAYVCCDKRLVMKCVVKTDFITDNKQHNDSCNLGKERTHSENDTYLKIKEENKKDKKDCNIIAYNYKRYRINV